MSLEASVQKFKKILVNKALLSLRVFKQYIAGGEGDDKLFLKLYILHFTVFIRNPRDLSGVENANGTQTTKHVFEPPH